jgi:hypothetical protein
MVGALVVLLALVGVYMVSRAITRQNPPTPVRAVDYRQDVGFARAQARFDLVAPTSLPAGWKSTTVSFTDGPRQHWHLGCLTDAGRYVGLEQANRPVSAMVKAYVDPQPSRGRPVTIRGARWVTYTDAGGDRGLVHRAGNTTTLVVGHDVPQAELTSYIRSLR